MEFTVLGPVRAWHDQRPVALGGRQRRCVLAVLLLRAGQVVPFDRLVELVWGEDPPADVRNAVYTHISRLRAALSVEPRVNITAQRPGYLLRTDLDRIDVYRFRHLMTRARGASDPDTAAALLRDALELWQGPPLADVVSGEPLHRLCVGLEEERLAALHERLLADLRLGRHAALLGELTELVGDHPLHEGFAGSLITALYRCGRQADALAAFQRVRSRLISDLGVEPGTGLRLVHQRVLAADPLLAQPATPAARAVVTARRSGPSGPAQLPADIAGFTGRHNILSTLDTLLAAGGPAPVLSVITGTAGVGKTAVAVHWAHRVRGRFPDGQLFVNLRGYAPGPAVRPIEALTRFLQALEVPAEQVPTDLDTAAALYRTLLSDRRMLVVLDNAGSAEQVRPLLPGSPGTLVVITGRDRMAGLVARDGAYPVPLDVLPEKEAVALLASVLGSARVQAEADAAADLVRACARLPLALRVAAAAAMTDPGRTIAGQAIALRSGDRLTVLEVDGDPQASVRAAFDLSYGALPPPAQRMFRLLGEVVGPDITIPAAAALAEVATGEAESLLHGLADANLIDQHVPGRYACHDLLRRYARDRCRATDSAQRREAALARLSGWYLSGADAAGRQLYPHMLWLSSSPVTPHRGQVDIAGRTRASAWLDAERPNLIAVVRHAAEHGPRPLAWRLAQTLRGYFFLRRYIDDWLMVAGAELAAARAAGDGRAEATAHLSLGGAYLRTGRLRTARTHLSQSLRLCETIGWPPGSAAALGTLGILNWRSGRPREAVRHYLLAIELCGQCGLTANRASNLANLSLVYRELGRLRDAADRYTEALVLFREGGSDYAEAVGLGNIGEIYHDLGRRPEALDHLLRALDAHREIGDRGSETDTLNGLAALYLDVGRIDEATDCVRTALVLARETSNRHSEGNVLNTLAAIRGRQGDHREAFAYHQQAGQLADSTENRYLRVAALVGAAAAQRCLGDLDGAQRRAHQALTRAVSAGYRVLEGHALVVLAEVDLDLAQPDRAFERIRQALSIHRETGHQPGETQAHRVLQRITKAHPDFERSRATGSDVEHAAATTRMPLRE